MGEAGYQEQLLMPRLKFKFRLIFVIEKYPGVQVPAGEISGIAALCPTRIKLRINPEFRTF
jgi:hypothetical protein